MTTTKSYSKSDRFASSYIAALKGQLPFAIVSGIVFLILFVVVFFLSTVNQYDPLMAPAFFNEYFKQGVYAGESQAIISLVLLAVMTLASTLTGLSYLHGKKTVDLYHSLPVSRPKLLGANLLATLTAVLGPYLAMYLLTVIIQLVTCAKYGCFGAEYFLFILFDILSAIVYIAVITAFVAFIAVNVGTVFDAFATTMAIGFAPPFIYVLSGYIWQSLVYGAYFEPGESLLCLSPFMFIYIIYFNLSAEAYSSVGPVTWDYGTVAAVLPLGLTAAAALFAAAVACYRRRKSEIAEQTQPRGVMQIIVKLVATFIGGSMFFGIFESSGLNSGLSASRLFFALTGAVCIGLIAEIILSRGVKRILKSLKWLLGAGVVYCLLLIGINADVTGYASRIPPLDSIESVQVNYRGRLAETNGNPHMYDNYGAPLTGAESIEIVRETHSIAMNNRPPKDFDYSYSNYSGDYSYNSIRISYKLKNGSTMSRTYSPAYVEAHNKLTELEDKDDFIRSKSTLFWAEQNPKYAKVSTVELYASFGSRSGQHANVLDEPELLLNAIKQDMLEQSLEDVINSTEPALGFIRVNFDAVDYEDYRLEKNLHYSYGGGLYSIVTVTREYKRTLEVLRQLELNGNFVDEPNGLDNIVNVGVQKSVHYGSGYFRSFDPWSMDSYGYTRDGYLLGNDYIVATDAQSIEATARAAKDMLFIPHNRFWADKYTNALFEMSDGSIIIKAVKIEDLPPSIRSEITESMPKELKPSEAVLATA